MSRQAIRRGTPIETSQLEDSWVVDTDEDEDYSPSSSSANLESSKQTRASTRQHSHRPDKSNDALKKEKSPENKNGNHKQCSGVYGTNQVGLRSRDSISSSSSEDLSAKRASATERSRLASSSEYPRKRQPRPAGTINTGPDLIMPSMHGNNMDGSWVGADKSTYSREIDRKPAGLQGRDTPERLRTKNPINRATKLEEKLSILDLLKPVLIWFYDVMGGALGVLKRPVSYVLAIYLLIGLALLMRNFLTNSVYSALSPICRLPGSSLLRLAMCQSGTAARYEGSEPPQVQFDQLMKVQSNFEAILEESAGGVSLPLNMKRGEASIRDLRQVVRYSSLRSKNELVLEFDGFIETARIASYDLQKFNSHVGRSVDSILATARWTKRVLDGIAQRDRSPGTIATFFTDKLLAPFQPLQFTEDALLDQYIQHTRVVEEEIHRLIAEAQALLHVLQNLEDRLDVIHGISIRDDIHAQTSKAEVLSQIWTMVGGNREKLGRFNTQLRLLGQVNSYRQSAIAHVSGTMVRLQAMGAELEDLRERVGGVELLGIRGGVPLSVHIENIELGVERLEKGRERAKGLENAELRKILKTGEPKGIEKG